jgi:hypothetical protein
MNRALVLSTILLAGCGAKPDQTSIPLYPGYVAKAQGRIVWFPTRPEFDEQEEAWRGHGAVEITSCIADPWPEGPGGAKAFIRIP